MASEKILYYQQAFLFFDRNNDGKISVQELMSALKKFGHTPTLQEAEAVLAQNGGVNSTLDFDTFSRILSALEDNEKSYRATFDAMDKDGNGYISAADLKAALRQVDDDLAPEDVEEMIKEADADKDGQVSYEDFRKLIATPVPDASEFLKGMYKR